MMQVQIIFPSLLNSDSLKYVFSKAINENKLVIKLAATTCSKKGVVFQVMKIFLHANKELGDNSKREASEIVWIIAPNLE